MAKKLFNNKTAKGLVSLITIIIVLSSILATSIFYENTITANAIKELTINDKPTISIKEVNDIKELSQLNEGWYEIRNGYVFYLDTFNSEVLLYVKVKNQEQQNGLMVVDEDGNIEFFEKKKISETQVIKEEQQINQQIQNQITGQVTGLERVSGLATYIWTTTDGKQQTSSIKPVGITKYALEYRDGDYDIRKEVEGDKTLDFHKKSSETNWVSGTPPNTKSTKKYEVYRASEQKWYPLPGEYESLEKAQAVVGGIGKVRPATEYKHTGTMWNVFDTNGNFLGQIQATEENAWTVGKLLADIKGVQLDNVYFPEFKASSPNLPEETFPASNKQEAREEYRKKYGTYPSQTDEIKYELGKPISSGNAYFLTDKNTGNRLATLPNIKPEDDLGQILDNYRSNERYKGRNLELVKAPSLEDAIRDNPDTPVEILKKGLALTTQQQTAQSGQQITAPTYHTPTIAGVKLYFVNGKNYPTEAEALTALDKANQDYTKAVTEKYAKTELARLGNAGKTLTGEITPDNGLLVKDSKGVYILKPITDERGNVVGVNPLQPVGDLYQTQQIIGDVKVIRTFKTEKQELQDIKITKGDMSASIDEATFDKIRKTEGKGFSIAQQGRYVTSDPYDQYSIWYSQYGDENANPTTNLRNYVEMQKSREFIDWCTIQPTCVEQLKYKKGTEDIDLDVIQGIKQGKYETDFQSIQDIHFTSFMNNLRITTPQNQILEFRDPQTKQLLERQTLSPDYTTQSGTKSTEQFKTAYFFDGKEIGKEQAEKLQKEGKTVNIQPDFPIYYSEEQRVDNELKYITSRQYETQFDKDKKPIVVYEATKINQKTGELEQFSYGKGNTFVVLNKEGKYLSGDPSLTPSAQTARNQYKTRQFFSGAERILTEFSGLGYYATFFFDEDSLLKWRDSVDKAFATLYLGTEYWSSAICGSYLDGADEGRAYAETPQGLAQVGAHVEATRTEPITNGTTGRIFLYKITFNVRNGDYAKDPRAPEEMNINVVLKGERTANVFRQAQKVERGSSFGRTGRNAIVQESPALYTQVCMTFDNVPFRWKLDNKEICNTILESSGAPTTITTSTSTSTSTTTTTTSGGAAESEVNDF